MPKPNKKDNQPLVVVVTEGRWGAFGDPDSARDFFLYGILQAQGGINESVPNGRYHYNVHRRFFKLVATLNPAR